MKRLCVMSLALVLILANSPSRARTLQDAGEVLTNTSITAMTEAGLNASIIVAKIRSSGTAFDVSTAELIRLKQEGVADEVITAMLEASGTVAGPVAPQQRTRLRRTQSAGEAAFDFPPPSESGIYFRDEAGPEGQLVLLEPSVYTQSKETGVWKAKLTYGIAKVRYKAILPSAHATLQIDTRRPVFYFIFDVPNAGLSSSGTVWGPTTSANEFVLAKMEVKKSRRELAFGEYGEFTGTRSGVSDKSVQSFDYVRLTPGVYKVTAKSDLADGEYCFFFGGSVAASGVGGGPKLFAFSIKAPRVAGRAGTRSARQ
jgi:hypothetical protein